MKAIANTILWSMIFPIIFLSCEKNDSDDTLIVNTYNKTISSSSKAMDSVSVDLDNDGIIDVRLMATNNQYSITFQPAIVKIIQIERLNNNIEFAYTLQYSNSNGFRIYNFGNSSLFLFYAKSFSSGSSIDSLVSFASTQYYCTSNYIFSSVPGFTYNEAAGDLNNSTGFMAFRVKKQDGVHYGWLQLSNSNNCMNATLISSAYCIQARKPIKLK